MKKLNAKKYGKYVLFLKERLDNDVSINSYLWGLITTLLFLMAEGYLPRFAMQSIKVDGRAWKPIPRTNCACSRESPICGNARSPNTSAG